MTKRPFSEVSEEEFLAAWKTSSSKTEVQKKLNITNFGSQNQRLNDLLKKYNLPRLGLKKVIELTPNEINKAINSPDITTLKQLCVKLNLPKKEQNRMLKDRIINEKYIVPKQLYRAIYGQSSTPWLYPRDYFIKQGRQIPRTCTKCNFIATKSSQIQLHHFLCSSSSPPYPSPSEATLAPVPSPKAKKGEGARVRSYSFVAASLAP